MAFSEGETLWGVGCLLISPLCVIYGLLNYQELKVPLLMTVGGIIGRLAIGAITVPMG